MSKTSNAKRKVDAASADRAANARKRRPHSISFKKATKLTKPSFADECDINRIVERYKQTGLVTHTAQREPQYGDAPNSTLFEAACVRAELQSQVEEGLDMAELEKNALEGSQEASDDQEAAAKSAPSESERDGAPADETAAQDEQSGQGI